MKNPALVGVSAALTTFLSLFPATTSRGAPGDLYEADFGSGTINKFTPDGAKSTFASDLGGPEGLAFDHKGNLFVSDAFSGTIFEFTPDGTRSVFASGLDSPAGLAFDGSGNLFEADYAGGDGAIFKFAPDGSKSTFATGLISPNPLAFDRSGNLYAADCCSVIFKFAPNGTKSIFATDLYSPWDLAFDSFGSLFETDTSDTIFKFASDGSKESFFSSSILLSGLAIDGSDNLFATAAFPDTIFKITPTGTQTVFASGLSGPVALAFEPVTEKLRNLSARGLVGTGDESLIGGFIVGGNSLANGTVLARAIGPSLSQAGVTNLLPDPVLELHNASGAIVASNDNWQDTQEVQITASGLAPKDPKESAIYATLPAGAYTAVVRGAGDATGVALVEVYSVAQ